MSDIIEICIPNILIANGHTKYQIILITNLTIFPSTYFKTSKRYSEILKLHKKIYKYFPIVLDFPKKTWLHSMDAAVIEHRRISFQSYFSFVFDFIIRNELKNSILAFEVFKFFNKSNA